MEKNWDEIRALAVEYAKDNMKNRKMNCSESVFEALIRCGAVDVPIETVAYATGFGGGGGCSGFTCGALSGAILANGVEHGRKDPSKAADAMELREKYYQRYNNLVSDFVKAAGSGICREISNGFADGYKDPEFRSNCRRIASEAAGIAVDYIKMDADEAAALQYDPSVLGIKNWL